MNVNGDATYIELYGPYVRRCLNDGSKWYIQILYHVLYCAIVGLECAMEANCPNLIGDINLRERVQRLATGLVRVLHHVPYKQRLRQLNLFSLKHKRL